MPPEVVSAGAKEADPDRRILLMLGARATNVARITVSRGPNEIGQLDGGDKGDRTP